MQSATNQKLLFARSQLDAFSVALGASQVPRDRVLAKGFADACTYQLMSAWHSLLQEVLLNYKVHLPLQPRNLGQGMLDEYAAACQQQGLVAPELNFMFNLAKDKQSFLGQLLALFEQALADTMAQEVPTASHSSETIENKIAVEQIEVSDALDLQFQQLERILEELKELIQHCRQTMQEY